MVETGESLGLQDLTSKDPPSDPVAMAGPVTAISRTTAQLALHAGWIMATLYRRMAAPPLADELPELPSANELQPSERRELELGRLGRLLRILAALPEYTESGLPTSISAVDVNSADFRAQLIALHMGILKALAIAEPETLMAYELGRSLRDTVSPPLEYAGDLHSPAPALARQLARARISTLQRSLATLSAQFPPHTTAVVAGSLGHWSDFASVTINPSTSMLKKGQSTDTATIMWEYLLRQGDLWLRLLVGPNSTAGLRRSQTILRRVRRRYGFMLAILAAALGTVIYLIVTYTSGALTVLTSIAAVVGALGISAKGIASMIATVMTKEATRPVFGLAGEAEEDAMVWAITTLPPVLLTSRGVRQLRLAGIAPTSHLGNV